MLALQRMRDSHVPCVCVEDLEERCCILIAGGRAVGEGVLETRRWIGNRRYMAAQDDQPNHDNEDQDENLEEPKTVH